MPPPFCTCGWAPIIRAEAVRLDLVGRGRYHAPVTPPLTPAEPCHGREPGLLRRKLRSALRMSPSHRRLIAEAVGALLVARVWSALPFRTLARRLGGLSSPQTTAATTGPLSPDQVAQVRAIRWAVGAAAPWLPFRTLCLQQAIAARAMLRRRGIASVLHLGVGDPTGSKLEAHAWLDAGGLQVTGYPVDPAHAEVGRFV